MNGRVRVLVLLLGSAGFACLATGTGALAAEPSALDQITRAYDSFRDLSGAFHQTSEIKELDRREEAGGQFRIVLPDHLRWDYDYPRKQSTEVKGLSIKVMQEGSDEVYQGVLDQDRYGSAPMTFLMGPRVFERDFIVTEPEPGILELRPRKDIPAIRRIRMTLVPGRTFPLDRLVVEDAYGNTNSFVFSSVRINTGLTDRDLALGDPGP